MGSRRGFGIGMVGLGLALGGEARAACSDGPQATFWCTVLDAGFADVEGGSRLGSALTSGDYNGDGFIDLAIGRPGRGSNDRGQVIVLTGSDDLPDGGSTRDALDLDIGDSELLGVPAALGTALATLDVDRDGIDDLLAGAPGQDLPPDFAGCGAGDLGCLDTGVIAFFDGVRFSEVALSSSAPGLFDSKPCGVSGDADDNYYGFAVSASRTGFFGGAPGIGPNIDETAGLVNRFERAGIGGGLTCDGAYKPETLFGLPNRTARTGAAVAAIVKGNGNGARVAFGAPFADSGSTDELGVVLVQYEIDDQNPAPSAFVQATHWPPAGNGAGDHFGAAVAAGDFDGDGDDDLAVSAPDKDVSVAGNPVADAGRIYLLRNDVDRIRPIADGILQQNSFAGQSAEAGDRFGAALAAGYIDADRYEDLVVGVPGEDVAGNPVPNEGFVAVIFGTPEGLTADSAFLQFREPDVGGSSVPDARFGSVLHVADLDLDGLDEIVIGLPERAVAGEDAAGKVYIRRGSGATGFDLRLAVEAFANTPQTPVPPTDTLRSVDMRAVLDAGPVQHAERLVLELDVSANGRVIDGGSSVWVCQPQTFGNGREGRRCHYDRTLYLGEESLLRSLRIGLKPGAAQGEVVWQARLSGDAIELDGADNVATGSIFFAVTDLLLADGFED